MDSSRSNGQLFLNFLEPCEVNVLLSDVDRAGGYEYLVNHRHILPSSLNLDQLATMKSILPQDGACLTKWMKCYIQEHVLNVSSDNYPEFKLRLNGSGWSEIVQDRFNDFCVSKSINRVRIGSHHVVLRSVLGHHHLPVLSSGQNQQIEQQASHLCDTRGCLRADHLCVETGEVNQQRRRCQGIYVHIHENTAGEFCIFQIDPCRHGEEHEKANDYLNAVFGPSANYLHGMAGAPYFNLGEFSKWDNLTTDQVLDAFNITIQAMSPEAGWGEKNALGAHAVFAGWYQLAFHGYEGGPDTSGDSSLDAKANATRDPRMTDICVTYLNAWYQYGFQELNWFVAGAGEIGKYGPWAILEDMRQETLVDTTTMFNATSPVAQLPRPAPKLKAIDQVRQSTIEMNFGILIPASKINATNYASHAEPYPDPYLRYLQPNATFYYPLKIVQSPIRINVTVYTSGGQGVLEGAVNNEQFIQVQTPKTADYDTFEPAPVMQFNINQRSVPSVAGFRMRVVQSGYNIQSFDIVISTD